MTSEQSGMAMRRLPVLVPWMLLGAVLVLWVARADRSEEPPSKPAEPKKSASPLPSTDTDAQKSADETEPMASNAAGESDSSATYTGSPAAGNPVREWIGDLADRLGDTLRGSDTRTGVEPPGYGATDTEPPDTTNSYGREAKAGYAADETRATEYDAATDDGGDAVDEDYGPPPAAGTAQSRATRELAYAFHLFDGFERGNAWAVESAADHAGLKLTSGEAAEGSQALEATFEARGKGQFELRREVKLDLTGATTFLVDVHNAGEPLDLTLAFRAGFDATLFTSPPKAILNGWNRRVAFDLSQITADGGGEYAASWRWSRDTVSRVSLIFGERGQKSGTVIIDNLRFDRAAADIGHLTKPTLTKITASAPRVERYETLELTVEFDADYQDYFDRSQIDVVAAFSAPSGKRLDVHGFVADTDAATGQPIWKVRFTPTEIGRWRYDVTVKTGGGAETSASYPFSCDHKADRRGFVRIAASDPRYFEFDDGTFYYPMGQNVCWATKYGYFLDKIQAYGGNYVRVWLCPWSLQLEDPVEPGKYDLRVAKQLDELLALCEQRGITLQLVLRYHDMQGESWAKNPYNSANGGPCYSPGEFFTDLTAKDLHKRFLDYVVARWGHSPALFAWELWNEADLARADREEDLIAWHREMAAHLKKIDVHGHLVTTSVATPGRANGLFELKNIDFIPVHFYARDVHKKIHENWVRYRKLRKPIFIGEFSGGHKPADDLADTKGVRIHAGLWLAFTTPMAGSAMPWWWDTYIDKNDLYGHWKALASFAKGVDRRGKNYEMVRSTAKLSKHASAALQGIIAPSEAYLWVHDERRIAPADQAKRPLLTAERPVTLAGMLGGRFRVEIWDTYAGEMIRATSITTAADGTLTFRLPPCDSDIAVKVTQEAGGPKGGRPRVTW